LATGIDSQTAESKIGLVERANVCLRAGDYARALDLLRGAAAEFSRDVELSELQKLAQEGVTRKGEADRLITESQDLFAQQKPAEAIEVLRKAYELDKKNSLARAILANALVEHAQSMVETDWLKAETLTNQALALNPVHPTAKTILNLIVDRKTTSSVEDWASQARKLQSSGDLFTALAWVAEGLAVHPNDPKLLQIHDAIQRDQNSRRRQARRGDLDDLRRMQREIDGAADLAAKQALAARIQGVAAKHWTDGEILSIANALLLRLGLVPQESSGASPRSKGATVILHVPRPSVPIPSPATNQSGSPTEAAPPDAPISEPPTIPDSPTQVAAQIPPSSIPAAAVPESKVPASKVLPSSVVPKASPREKVKIAPPELQLSPERATTVITTAPPVAAPKASSSQSTPKREERSSSTTLIVICAAAMILVAVGTTFFFAHKHRAEPIAQTKAVSPAASESNNSSPAISTPEQTAPPPPSPEPSATALPASSAATTPALPSSDQPPAASGQNVGSLLIVAGQDEASVFLNGKRQRQLTRGGQLRLPNLELRDYVVQVSKSGYQDPPQQSVRVRNGDEAKLVFNLQPQPRMASLSIQGGVPGVTVLVDQSPVGTIQADGTLVVSTVNPGDHTVELRKDRFKPRQLKKHFVAGATVSVAAAEAALDAAPGELKISFTPPDAKVALVKGDLLKIVSSGVPLSLDAGTYTLTTRTADRVTRSSSVEVVAGQSKALDLSLAANGMSKFDDPGAWKHEGDSFSRRGGDFVLYGVVPTSGTLTFSAMPTKGHLLQWVFNYTDPRNYLLLQIDENNFYRSVVRNGEKTDEIIVPHKGDKKGLRTLQIRVSPTELVHQMKLGDSWKVLDRWTQPGANLSQGKFGFYIPGNDQIEVSSFAHYADLNTK